MSEHINIQTLPVDWFPDLEAVKVFLQGPRYQALSSLAIGGLDVELPEPLASEARQAASFVGRDLLELGRYAALLSSPETFVAQREPGEWHGEWPKRLSMLSAIALAGNYLEGTFAPLLEMQAEAAQAEKDLAETERITAQIAVAERVAASAAIAEPSPTATA